ncbi:MAG: shikimate kinase [Blastocatellia bacterium]|nr:shikimate kinase [Blastocatellia bacterium]
MSDSLSRIENLEPHIFLVGFMASGKSTIGPLLAVALDRPFIDLDPLIEARTGRTIAQLIASEGEDRFRRIETEILRETAEGAPAVIAPGGGAATRAENRDLMSNSGIIVWLDTPFELCWLRIQSDRTVRPLAPDKESARTRYEQRLPLYRHNSIQIRTDEDLHPEKAVAEIVARIDAGIIRGRS